MVLHPLAGGLLLFVALAQPDFLASGPGPSERGLYLSPIEYQHRLDGPAGGPSSLWYLTQWSGASPLNASAALPGGGPCPPSPAFTTLWHVCTAAAAAAPTCACMQRRAADGALALLTLQDGASLPCGAEYDLFLAPTDGAYANAPPNVRPLPLAAARAFTCNFTVELLAWRAAARCGPQGSCGPSGRLDYGYITLGVVLSNAAQAQTIFYQVILGDTRGAPTCPGNDPCAPWGDWYGGLPTVGFSESIGRLAGSQGGCLAPGAPEARFSLPLLGRLLQAVAEGAARFPGLNASAAAWTVTGLYLGTGMEGSTSAAVRISSVAVATA
jgi:hypothetical protein